MSMLFFQQLLNGLVVGTVYALFALGFTLIFGVHHVLNLAHGAVFMVGAFVGLVAVTTLNLPFVPAIALAAVTAGLLSVALDWLAFRPLRRRAAPEFAALISSIGAGLVITNVAQVLSQTKIWRYPFGTFPIEIFTAFGLRITLLQLTIAGCMIITVAALVFFLF